MELVSTLDIFATGLSLANVPLPNDRVIVRLSLPLALPFFMTHSLTHSLTHSPTHSLTHARTHSLTLSLNAGWKRHAARAV